MAKATETKTTEKRKTAVLHDLDVEAYLAECVRIYPEQLQEEFVRLPSDTAYWSERHARAVREHLTMKLVYDRTFAVARVECRAQLLDTSAKVTEAMVEAAVDQHEGVNAARERLIDAEVEKIRSAGVLDALRAKRDMLISLGAHVRIEMANDPILRERVAGAKLVGE